MRLKRANSLSGGPLQPNPLFLTSQQYRPGIVLSKRVQETRLYFSRTLSFPAQIHARFCCRSTCLGLRELHVHSSASTTYFCFKLLCIVRNRGDARPFEAHAQLWNAQTERGMWIVQAFITCTVLAGQGCTICVLRVLV